ncbi:MAG: hypothetical protein ACD_65C00255G0003 [uncultured bacterium]|nr:MAG: hypothetical protein ACD_65C00255G0003 [uncultured bacterium]
MEHMFWTLRSGKMTADFLPEHGIVVSLKREDYQRNLFRQACHQRAKAEHCEACTFRNHHMPKTNLFV